MSTAHEYLKRSVEKSLKAKLEFFETQSAKVVDLAEKLAKTVQAGGKILLFGNGGSAADAQHMAAELVGRMLVERKRPVPAIALTTDTSCLTAVSNDFSYDDVFDFQVRALAQKGDVAIAISTSGNSKNVVKAANSAKELGMFLVSFTGGKGGTLKAISDLNLNVNLGENSSMIQETHIAIVHAAVDLMDRFFLSDEWVKLNV
ncbi:MAG: SIS domain-containing protein [Bacteriovoracia bacterium]